MNYKLFLALISIPVSVSANGYNQDYERTFPSSVYNNDANFWNSDKISIGYRHSSGEFDYTYSGENFDLSAVNPGCTSNCSGLLFPKTSGKQDYDINMVSVKLKGNLGNDFFYRMRYETNVDGSSDVVETNTINSQSPSTSTSRETALRIASTTDDITKDNFEFLLGKKSNSRNFYNFNYYLGLGYHNEEFYTQRPTVEQNKYNVNLNLNDEVYNQYEAESYIVKAGIGARERIAQNILFNGRALVYPYIQYDATSKYQSRRDVLQPFNAELEGDGWGYNLRADLTYLFSYRASVSVFYEFDHKNIDGETNLTYSNNGNIVNTQSSLDSFESNDHNIGVDFNLYF